MEGYLDTAPCCYFSASDDGRLLQVNATLCANLGFTQAELEGQKADFIFTLATRIFFQTHLFPLLKMQGRAVEIFITLQAKDKSALPVLINAERKEKEGQWVTAYAGLVVHNRKKFEDELVAAKKAAEAALQENTALINAKAALQQHTEQLDLHLSKISQQNRELKQLNQVLTHDIQEPLRKVFVFANLLKEQISKKENPEPAAEKLTSAATQIRSIISGLQQYVWLTETVTEFKEVNIPDLIKLVQRQLEAEYPDVQLVVEMEPVALLQADGDQMQLLLYHLLANAIRFRKEGAPAFVQVSATILQENKFVNLEDKYSYNDYLKLEFKDQGQGFPAEHSQQLFQLFKRLHPASGRGIGLALSKKIVENHFGKIAINSSAGEGAVVTVLLPLQRGAEKGSQ